MESTVYLAPILPGKSEGVRKWAQESNGPRKNEYAQSRRKYGMTRELSFIQPTPQGDLLLGYYEAEDALKSFQDWVRSNDPFDVWEKEQFQSATGLDLSQPQIPQAELLFENEVEGAGRGTPLLVAAPILPGKTEAVRAWAAQMNSRLEDQRESFMRTGMKRIRAYLLESPDGAILIAYYESDDLRAAFDKFAASQEPFDKWTKENLQSMIGIDLNKPLPFWPEMISEWEIGEQQAAA